MQGRDACVVLAHIHGLLRGGVRGKGGGEMGILY